MKMVGEVNFSLMGKAKKPTKKVAAVFYGEIVECPCIECGKPMFLSVAKIIRYGKEKRCYTCYKKGQDEINQATINLARKKGLIK